MRQSPQSPTSSISSGCSSPIHLQTEWCYSTTTTARDTPQAASGNSNVHHGDSDMYGSEAWRKKRGVGRQNGGTKSDKENGSYAKLSEMDTKRWAVVQLVEQRACRLRRQYHAARKWMASVSKQPSNALSRDGLTFPTANSSNNSELSSEAIVQQTKLLCGSYIYQRLTAKGLMNKRVHVAPYHCLLSDELFSAGQELERLYPKTYSDVSRRICMTMTSAQLVRRALTAVLEGTFRSGVTWAKVVSMVTITAAFAEECVVQGHPNFVEDVMMCVGHFVSLNLTDWLASQGGWAAFPTSRPPAVMEKPSEKSLLPTILIVIASIFLLLLSKALFDDT